VKIRGLSLVLVDRGRSSFLVRVGFGLKRGEIGFQLLVKVGQSVRPRSDWVERNDSRVVRKGKGRRTRRTFSSFSIPFDSDSASFDSRRAMVPTLVRKSASDRRPVEGKEKERRGVSRRGLRLEGCARGKLPRTDLLPLSSRIHTSSPYSSELPIESVELGSRAACVASEREEEGVRKRQLPRPLEAKQREGLASSPRSLKHHWWVPDCSFEGPSQIS